MSEDLNARVDALWRRGPCRGEGPDLRALAGAAAHPRLAELRAFATLATLIDGDAPLHQVTMPDDEEADPCTRALYAAVTVWSGARFPSSDDAPGSMISALCRAEEQCPADDRLPAVRAWAALVSAECALASGQITVAQALLTRLAASTDAPEGAVIEASVRLALLGGLARPSHAVALLDEVAERARGAAPCHGAVYALVCAGVLALAAGDETGARTRLRTALARMTPRVPSRYATLCRLLLTVIEAPTHRDAALAHAASAIRDAAAAGDLLAYICLIGLAARLYLASGRTADAVATLSGGIAQLTRAGGPSMAASLRAEREALRAQIGQARYDAAVLDVLAALDEDQARDQPLPTKDTAGSNPSS